MGDNGRVPGEYGDFQDLVDEVSALLGAPATLEDRDFRLIAFGVHDSDDSAMDPVRTRSILTRRSTAEVRAWFERFGIARATGPIRIPAAPSAGVRRGRLCLPVRHGGVVYGYVWLLDEAEHSPAQLVAAMSVAARIGDRLAEVARTGSDTGLALRTLLTATARSAREAAEDGSRAALGPDADEPHALLCVRLPAPAAPDTSAGVPPPADVTRLNGVRSIGSAGRAGWGREAAPPEPDGGRWGGVELPAVRVIPAAAALTRVSGGTGGTDLVALLVRLRSAHVLAPARTAGPGCWTRSACRRPSRGSAPRVRRWPNCPTPGGRRRRPRGPRTPSRCWGRSRSGRGSARTGC